MTESQTSLPVGRLLRANATGFVLGCRVSDSDDVSFGGLVRVSTRNGALHIYGLVHDITVPDDLMVKQLAVTPATSEEQWQDQLENRQLPIEMSVLAVGYREGGDIRRRIPPRPPLSLDRVELCTPAEIREFTEKLGYLRLVLRQYLREVPIEQLIVAHIVQAHAARKGDDDEARKKADEWALKAAKELIAQLRDDHATLLPLLEALGEALPSLGDLYD
jgi:hypothetical protein